MKKKLLSLFLAGAMTASLVACGAKPAAEEGAGKEADAVSKTAATEDDPVQNLIKNTTGPVDLTLWCSETEAYQTVMKELVDEFKSTYPDVEFNITIGAESEANCKDDVLKDVEAAADVFIFPDDQLPELVKAGALQSVDATYTYDPTKTNTSATVEAASIDGKLYAYPMTASNGYFLFYNKNDLSEEDVKSWDTLLA